MIFLGNGTDDAAGISGRDNVTGNVPRYDGARTDDDVVADGDAGIDDDVTADPDVRADGHGSGIFEVGITHFSIDGVPCRITTAAGRQRPIDANDRRLPASKSPNPSRADCHRRRYKRHRRHR